MASKRCEGKRRKWRGNRLGDFVCGRKAQYVFQTYVGLTRSHLTCGDDECTRSITGGYPAQNVKELTK